MHTNPAFRDTSKSENIAFAKQRGFGVLAINGASFPLLSHIPFHLSSDGKTAELHLVRSNPIARAVSQNSPATIAVSGPDSYISPDWYDLDDQVPTWNYVAVHLSGRLERRPADELRASIDMLADAFEQRLAPKPIWKTTKIPDDSLDRMMRMIVPFRLYVESIEGTWKLNQNKPDSARVAAAAQIEAHGIGHETAQLSTLMKDPPKS